MERENIVSRNAASRFSRNKSVYKISARLGGPGKLLVYRPMWSLRLWRESSEIFHLRAKVVQVVIPVCICY